MKRVLTVALVVAALVGVYLYGGRDAAPVRAAAAAADIQSGTDGVVVDGVGRVSGTPDVLRVTFGVSVRRDDVSSAMRSASTRQGRLTTVLKRGGVAAKDLQTTDVSISRSYDRRGRPDGYRVTQTLTAKLRDLGRAGRLMSDAVAVAGNEALLEGVSFDLEDNAALLKRARDAAFADAKAKASQYADLSGRSLDKVELVTESQTWLPHSYRSAHDAFAAGARKAVPIQPGTSDVSVAVTVRWSLR